MFQPFDPNKVQPNVPQCSGKRPYETSKEANAAMRAISKRNGFVKSKVYYCDACAHFHFGRERTAQKRRRP